MKLRIRTIVGLGLVVTLLIPPAAYLIAALSGGFSPAEAFSAMIAQLSAEKRNLLACTAIGLLPMSLLVFALWICRLVVPNSHNRPALALGGVLPILAVLLWVHLEYWPVFLPGRTYPGFPHGIEMVIGPLFFAPIGGLIGMVVAGILWRFVR